MKYFQHGTSGLRTNFSNYSLSRRHVFRMFQRYLEATLFRAATRVTFRILWLRLFLWNSDVQRKFLRAPLWSSFSRRKASAGSLEEQRKGHKSHGERLENAFSAGRKQGGREKDRARKGRGSEKDEREKGESLARAPRGNQVISRGTFATLSLLSCSPLTGETVVSKRKKAMAKRDSREFVYHDTIVDEKSQCQFIPIVHLLISKYNFGGNFELERTYFLDKQMR